MDLDVQIKKPDWDPHPEKTKTQNWEWRQCVIVTFPNCAFKWLPTYRQLQEIREKLAACEKINRGLAIKHNPPSFPVETKHIL